MALIIRGVIGLLLLLAVSACAAVACGYRGVDVWVWDWADALRTPYGNTWRSLTTMRISFGILGVMLLAGPLRALVS
ncbi:hypothetical protein ACF1A5_12435 [Streptomyces sp. NPDC014864]|uniref:hypothetical protein n=1 Tax=Streptomyces sp. NPDC014864 TaxID=3364924 RepID=UPI0036F8A3D5